MARKIRRFNSKEDWRKYLAFEHMHIHKGDNPRGFRVTIAGKPHKVKHHK